MENPGFTVEVADFSEIADEFHARVSRMVWCNVATVDHECRPRSRIMHPIWDGATGYIGTWGTSVRSDHQRPSVKMAHLRQHPHASLAYIAEPFTPVYVDCQVEVIEDAAGKAQFCELARSVPEPYGYDPAPLFGGPENPHFVVLKLAPTRIALVEFPAPPGKVHIWRQ
ncbi:MAG: pyridoxamine 5'-phosphate oxidase family protein [Thermomicrobiales bacterium]